MIIKDLSNGICFLVRALKSHRISSEVIHHDKHILCHHWFLWINVFLHTGEVDMQQLQWNCCSDTLQRGLNQCSFEHFTPFTPLHCIMALTRHPWSTKISPPVGPRYVSDPSASHISMTSIQGMEPVFLGDNKHIDVLCIPSQLSTEV